MFDNLQIYAIGDLHGDIMPFIVCLRDCCKVIKSTKHFDLTIQDTYLVNELSKKWDDSTFDSSLGYEWIGEGSQVVLCGDIIDNIRPINELLPYKKQQEFPMEEARILMFINELNKQAASKNGKIYKVLGNHDFNNLNGRNIKQKLSNGYFNYTSRYAYEYEGYKQTPSKGRLEYFTRGNTGSSLLAEGGIYFYLMIKDFIFVHGGIVSDLLTFKNIANANDELNKYAINNTKEKLPLDYGQKNNLMSLINYKDRKDPTGLLRDRTFGFNNQEEEEMCNSLFKKFNELCKSCVDIESDEQIDSFWKYSKDCDPSKMKVVMGHCPQNYWSKNSIYNTSFNTIINEDCTSIEYSQKVETINSNDTNINGITVSCGSINDNPSIFRIDVGMSRAFNIKDISKDENRDKIIMSRTPQVLKIVYSKDTTEPKMSIIKSTLKNTLIHVPDMDKQSDLGIVIPPDTSYMKKYLKYKLLHHKLKNNKVIIEPTI
jgi:hypothetical protein